MHRPLLFALALCLLGCGDPLDQLPERGSVPSPTASETIPDASTAPSREGGAPGIDASPGVEVAFEPPASPFGVPSVVRIHLRLPEPATSSDALLVQGTLSASQLRDIAKGKVSNTVAERQVKTLFWVDPDDSHLLVAAPLTRLASGETYTLATVSPHASVAFVVADEGPPLLRRTWPLPLDAAASPHFAIYCGDRPLGLAPRPLQANPGRVEGTVRQGIGSDRVEVPHCLRWDAAGAEAGDGLRLLPPALELDDGQIVALDPVPLLGSGIAPGLDPVLCSDAEVSFGPACLSIDDDRVLVRPPYWGSLWALEAADASLVHIAFEGTRFLLRPLPPATTVTIRAAAVDAAGRLIEIEQKVETLAARAHLVVNEVMATPLGPEPAQEWIELYNDGLAPAELGGLELDVNGTKTVLPEATLAPGAYALVVSEAFVVGEGSDPPPASGTLLVRVPKLGKQGLSNEGPTITLRTADGVTLSRFPSLKPKKGVSVIRVRPDALDELPSSFALDPLGSSSPGSANPRP